MPSRHQARELLAGRGRFVVVRWDGADGHRKPQDLRLWPGDRVQVQGALATAAGAVWESAIRSVATLAVCGADDVPSAAPELAAVTPYAGEPIDVWSAGILLFALLVGSRSATLSAGAC